MTNQSSSPLLAFIRHLAASGTHAELTDGELLERFARQREETVFLTLVQRHGPMVLGICQGILHDDHDAEDIFQATFLVLVRKPASIGKPASLASWLHGVAYRLAMKARVAAARRRACEKEAAAMPRQEPQDPLLWHDLRPVLHEEVDRLPERYRLPFVLCYLEGKTNQEAADLLGWPKGTVLSSLSRARQRLRGRLTRRGVALGAGVLALLRAQNMIQAAVPAALCENTLKAASLFVTNSAGIAPTVLAHARSMLHTGFLAKLKATLAAVLALAAVGSGVGLLVYRPGAGAESTSATHSGAPVERAQERAPAVDNPAAKPTDLDRLQGAWTVTSSEYSNRPTTALDGRRLVFEQNRFTLHAGPREVRGVIPTSRMTGDFRLAAGRIDLDRGFRTLRGIYALTGDALRIRLCSPDIEQPLLSFDDKLADGQLQLVLKRE
jgi:RNA polymerase sigma factor (sigma-70 family)